MQPKSADWAKNRKGWRLSTFFLTILSLLEGGGSIWSLTYAGMDSDRQLCSQYNTVLLSSPEEQTQKQTSDWNPNINKQS